MSQQVFFFYCAHAKKTIPSNFVLTRHVTKTKAPMGSRTDIPFLCSIFARTTKTKGCAKTGKHKFRTFKLPAFS